MSPSFADLGLIQELLDTVAERGYAAPTPIQADAIPPLLDGRDVMGQAQTGTGKTAAFTLPMVQRLAPDGLQALILTPTRELAIQTAEAVYRYGHQLGIRVLPIYGGQSYDRQKRRLRNGVHVVVGTPGRTLDLIRQRELDLSAVHYVVLDEADEMLKMGFIEDVEAILGATDAETRQTTLFSATLPDEIRRLATQYMHDPTIITIEADAMTVENVAQRYYVVNESDKIAALSRLLEVEELDNTLIFARTKVGAAELADTLIERGFPAEAIHGDLPQAERERILRRYRAGYLTILVATDVVARGVDIPAVSHVINFDIPQLGIEYVHRIGRTGRAGRAGDAITLITPRQRGRLRRIEEYTRQRITKATLPTRDDVLYHRNERFMAHFTAHIAPYLDGDDYVLLDELYRMGYPAEQVAVAAIKLLRADEANRPLEKIKPVQEAPKRSKKNGRNGRDQRDARDQRNGDKPRRRKRDRNGQEEGMVKLHMDVGRVDGVRPGDVVYAVASASGIPGRVIGHIAIEPHATFLDVPEEHVGAVLGALRDGGRIRGTEMRVDRADTLLEHA